MFLPLSFMADEFASILRLTTRNWFCRTHIHCSTYVGGKTDTTCAGVLLRFRSHFARFAASDVCVTWAYSYILIITQIAGMIQANGSCVLHSFSRMATARIRENRICSGKSIAYMNYYPSLMSWKTKNFWNTFDIMTACTLWCNGVRAKSLHTYLYTTRPYYSRPAVASSTVWRKRETTRPEKISGKLFAVNFEFPTLIRALTCVILCELIYVPYVDLYFIFHLAQSISRDFTTLL